MSRSSLFAVVLLTIVLSVLATLAVLYGLVTRYSPEALLGNGEVKETSGSAAAVMQETGQAVNIPDVVEETIPAVVSVVITAEVPIVEQYYEEFSPFGGFFGGGFQVPRQRQIGTEEREIGGGTGFFVSSDGYIVTNRHVVDQKGVSYSIVTNEGESHEIEVVARDPMLDIAILRVTDSDEETFPYLRFAAGEVRLGEEVIAIGNALAEFPNSVSVGVISGVARNIMANAGFGRSESLESLIQTDAAINQGNSGGPLLNTRGEVVGVNVAMAGGSENIGFSLPASMVREVYESVAEFGEIRRPYLGVRYLQLTDEVIARNNLDVEYGVLIVRGENRADLAVIPGSPADKAGLEANDVILKVDDSKLDGTRSFAGILRDYAVGDVVTLTVLSDGEEEVMEVTLEAAPEI